MGRVNFNSSKANVYNLVVLGFDHILAMRRMLTMVMGGDKWTPELEIELGGSTWRLIYILI